MNHTFKTASLCLALWLAASSGAVSARDCTPSVHDGWVRMPPASMPMMAGFARIQNGCPTPVTIVGASSPSFGSVDLHETRIIDGISRMRAVHALRLAPDGAAVFKPGGMHLMLMQPRVPLKAGSKVAIEFKLADGRKVLGEFEVRKPAL